jgi:hypothetical protein
MGAVSGRGKAVFKIAALRAIDFAASAFGLGPDTHGRCLGCARLSALARQ